MEKDKDDRVSLNEFLNIWSESKQSLERNIQEIEYDIQDSQKRKEQLSKHIEMLKKQRGSGGSTNQKNLRILIKEAKSIPAETFRIIVSTGGMRYETFELSKNQMSLNEYFEL